jgi:hypothetical protein
VDKIMEPTYVSGHSAWVENIPFAFELIKERNRENRGNK